jgi:hypothetical protein
MVLDILTEGAAWTLGDTTVGIVRAWPALLVPLAVALFWWLLFRRQGTSDADRTHRRRVFVTRIVLALLLVGAAMGPYTVATRETPGEPRVTLLVDESASMGVAPPVADDLESDLNDAGVAVSRVTAGNRNRSAVGETIGANLRANGSLVVVSDGQVTDGRSLRSAAEQAATLNATVSTVAVTPNRTERYVRVAGPSKVSAGVEATFGIAIEGVNIQGTPQVTVTIDGEEIATKRADNGFTEVTHTFSETGSHRVTAQLQGQDRYAANDVFRKTVQVVRRPEVLYVSRTDYPLEDYLEGLYNVTRVESVPADLDPYYAVVMQNLAAGDVGNVTALQRFVIDGNGLVVAGGSNAYENGGYESSSVSSMLPVQVGESEGGASNIVLAIDRSGSAQGGMTLQKGIALDVLNQLDDSNTVGIVAFNFQAFSIARPARLGETRGQLETRIRRLTSGGATEIEVGLRGAEEMLGNRRGTIILISDGGDDPAAPGVVADQLGRRGIRVISVGVGQNIRAETLQRVADASGGTYFRADETNRLRLLFGGESRQFQSEGLTVVDRSHFITSGVQLTAAPESVNQVSVKDGADFLVSGTDGTPALASWRFGLGRVVSVTVHDEDDTLGGLLRSPDSLVVSKSVNWAIGDPERKATDTADAADTRVGSETTIRYRGTQRPDLQGLDFRQVNPGVYEATVVPQRAGYESVLDASYAVNYPAEYAGFGPARELDTLVETTGGRSFEPNQADAIARFATEQARRVRDVRDQWTWLALVLALLLYMGEVIARRIQVYQGRTGVIP